MGTHIGSVLRLMPKPLRYALFLVGFLLPLWKWGIWLVVALLPTLGGGLVLLSKGQLGGMVSMFLLALWPIAGIYGLWAVSEATRNDIVELSRSKSRWIFFGLMAGPLAAIPVFIIRHGKQDLQAPSLVTGDISYDLALIFPVLVAGMLFFPISKRSWTENKLEKKTSSRVE